MIQSESYYAYPQLLTFGLLAKRASRVPKQ